MSTPRSLPVLLSIWTASALLAPLPRPRAQAVTAPVQELVASDPAGGSGFGVSIAVDGPVLVCGAPSSGTAVSGAYVFRWNGSAWQEEQKLVSGDSLDFGFGGSVAISGDVIVVGALNDFGAGNEAGAAYVFRRSGSQWLLEQKLVSGGVAPFSNFGRSVAVDGDRIAVGAYRDDTVLSNAGAVYTLRWNGGAWIHEQMLVSSELAAEDQFGTSVALRGDRLACGAPYHDGPPADVGAVYEFEWSGTWVQVQRLPASGAPGPLGYFGFAIARSANWLWVGAPNAVAAGTMSGTTHAFRRQGGMWGAPQILKPPSAKYGDSFGSSVAVVGDLGVAGAPESDFHSTYSGLAVAFRWNGSSWAAVQALAPPPLVGYLGRAVAVAEAGAITSAMADFGGLPNGTAAYAYELCQGASTLATAVQADVLPFGSPPASAQTIGTLGAMALPAGRVRAEFAIDPAFSTLDNCCDFLWISVERRLELSGLAVQPDPFLGALPGIDPPPLAAGCIADGEPFAYTDAEWAAGIDCLSGESVRQEGVYSRFVGPRAVPSGTSGTREFDTYLVAVDTHPGGGAAQSFCVLDGFSWTVDGATGQTRLCGALGPDHVSVQAALATGLVPGHAGSPGFPGWDALTECQLDSCPALEVDVAGVSLLFGGTATFALNAGLPNALNLHLLLGSSSGTAPGIALGSLVLPLVPDAYFAYALANPNQPPLAQSFGVLDGAGLATAHFQLPAGLTSLAGTTAHHAYVVLKTSTLELVFASNAVPLVLF